MAKSFVLMEKIFRAAFRPDNRKVMVINALDKEQRDNAIANGWDFVKGVAPLLVDQDGGGVVVPGECDLTEINQAIEILLTGYDQCLKTNNEHRLRIAVLETTPSGGASFATRNIPLEIYGGLGIDGRPIPQDEGAIDLRAKYTRAKLSGNMLSIRFSIANGGKLNEGTYYIKLLDPEIKGYHYPMGIAKWHGNRHDQTLDCHAEWQQYGADWFIRMPIYNYDYYGAKLNIDFGKDYPDLGVKSAAVQVAGTSYLGKRCPVVAQNDTIIVTIPVFPL